MFGIANAFKDRQIIFEISPLSVRLVTEKYSTLVSSSNHTAIRISGSNIYEISDRIGRSDVSVLFLIKTYHCIQVYPKVFAFSCLSKSKVLCLVSTPLTFYAPFWHYLTPTHNSADSFRLSLSFNKYSTWKFLQGMIFALVKINHCIYNTSIPLPVGYAPVYSSWCSSVNNFFSSSFVRCSY